MICSADTTSALPPTKTRLPTWTKTCQIIVRWSLLFTNPVQWRLPIHTLDKTWLWCETWCSYSWLPQAKTIDLCSNPKTKEPKLDRARRQIPEWVELDNEVAALAERVRQQQTEADTSNSVPHDEL